MSNWNLAAVFNKRKCLLYECGVAYSTLHQGKDLKDKITHAYIQHFGHQILLVGMG